MIRRLCDFSHLCVLLLLLAGCPPQSPPPGGSVIADPQSAAVDAASEAVLAVAQAVSVAQSAVDLRAQDAPAGFQFGICPMVTGAPAGGEAAPLILTIAYSGGCAAAGDFFCSGNATGQFSRPDRTLSLDFVDVLCSDHALAGSVQLNWTVVPEGADLSGTWGLTTTTADEATIVNGSGNAMFDRTVSLATITSFAGQVGEPESAFDVTMADVQVPFFSNDNLIASAGQVIVTGQSIAPLTIEFTADSPITGDVEVTPQGGTPATVNLFQLHGATDQF